MIPTKNVIKREVALTTLVGIPGFTNTEVLISEQEQLLNVGIESRKGRFKNSFKSMAKSAKSKQKK
tara:strand:- start:1503 stop:1700 length:198 start_codon:yes stop_codon:yes gene_type:complete